VTVTLADDGGTVNVSNGGEFLLKLGADYDWEITIDNPDVVSRVMNIAVINGAQGVYQAHQPGHATLSATGTPVCPEGQICSNLALAFNVEIDVQ
jgi:predicted secreted protein